MSEADSPGLATAPQGVRPCPRCQGAMAMLKLPSHRPLPVVVDHCAACRLVWFDAMESIQLDGLGWTRLLRAMEDGHRRELPVAATAQPHCLHCQAPLRQVQNRTRFGPFSALECPQRHGQLQSHTGLLAERGLVRPLGQAERLALRRERHALHCFNCGGPAEEGDDDCRWCATPLVVVDLPRLAHSLRLRLSGEFGASPQIVGTRLPWPCRGCGAPLDATRQTACAHCAHPVVAHELPDLLPLLEAAEAELQAAIEQARARRAEFGARPTAAPLDAPRPGVATPATQRSRDSNAPIRTRRQRPVSPAQQRAALWPLAGLAVLGLALLFSAAAPHLDRPVLQRLMLQPVGHDPAGSWSLVGLHESLAGTTDEDCRLLRTALFDQHLRQLLGDRWDPAATVGSLLAASRQQGTDGRGTETRWMRAYAAAWERQPGSDHLPAELAAEEPRWRLQAGGLWLEEGGSRGLWRLALKNRSAHAMPLHEVGLRSALSPTIGMPWRCKPPATAPGPVPEPAPTPTETPVRARALARAPAVSGLTWVPAGATGELICHTAFPVHLAQDSWPPLVQRLLRGEAVTLDWDLHRMGRAAQPLVQQRWQADAVALAQASGRSLLDNRAPGPTPRQRWAQASTAQRALALAGLLALAMAGYSAAALLSLKLARGLWLLVALLLAVWGGRGEGAASVLLVGALLVPALAIGLACEWVARLYLGWRRRRLGL